MIRLALNAERRVLLVTYSLAISRAGLVELDGLLKPFVARHGTMDTIIDFSGAPPGPIDTQELIGRARTPSRMPGRRRFFVAGTDHAYGMLRLYGAHQEGIDEKAPTIVRRLDEALAALGVAADSFAPVA